jgi:hypothetical protein
MAKKTKRQASSGNGKAQAVPVTATEPAARTSGFTSSARSADKEFNPDYSYVIKDLKRIGVLAGIFFSALVILSFFLR